MIFVKRCPARFSFVLSSPIRKWLLQPARVVRSLGVDQTDRVLDLGAGSGVVSEYVLNTLPNARLVLVDAQLSMLVQARKRVRRHSTRALLANAVAEALPFPNGSFDAVLMVTVLGEVDNVIHALREVHRVLRPGGIFSVTEHLPDPDFRSISAVRRLLADSGFRERNLTGNRWSYTLSATRVGQFAA
ncbi:MAG TPA: class I SAM-dependent methyltransferase [Longimicrobiales bacterium]